jgi:hypothetical protein
MKRDLNIAGSQYQKAADLQQKGFHRDTYLWYMRSSKSLHNYRYNYLAHADINRVDKVKELVAEIVKCDLIIIIRLLLCEIAIIKNSCAFGNSYFISFLQVKVMQGKYFQVPNASVLHIRKSAKEEGIGGGLPQLSFSLQICFIFGKKSAAQRGILLLCEVSSSTGSIADQLLFSMQRHLL